MDHRVRPTVGVIGLGRMGSAIASRLRSAGVTVLATDRRPEVTAVAEEIGARWAPGAADLAAGSEVVITVLPGPEEVRSVIEPVLGHLPPGGAWIDMTSGVPQLSQEIRTHAGPGARVLECPVGGDPPAARDGRLLGYLGAEAADLEAHRPLLEILCHRFVHVGEPGSGYAVKLLVNLLWFGQALAVSEALALASRLGLDPDDVRETLRQGPAASRFLEGDAARLLAGDDMTSFGLARCVEELEGVLALGAGQGVQLPIAERVTAIHRDALGRYGDVDGELLGARWLADRLGVAFGHRVASS